MKLHSFKFTVAAAALMAAMALGVPQAEAQKSKIMRADTGSPGGGRPIR